MSALSDYLEAALLNWVRGVAMPSAPATTYLALYTSATTDAGGGAEVSGGAYARFAIAASGWSAPADDAEGKVISNVAELAFAVASSSWGTVTHAALQDASSGGNRLFHGPLAAQKVVDSGDQIKFGAGELRVKLY